MFRRDFRYKTSKLRKGQIRLFTILPGDEPTKLKCVSHTALDNSKYEALSYRWVSDWAEYAIFLSGQTFWVNFDLDFALQHLRHTINQRILWVDAICINQGDDLEKGVQIEQMGRVYSQALRVVVWPGRINDERKSHCQSFAALRERPLPTRLLPLCSGHKNSLRWIQL